MTTFVLIPGAGGQAWYWHRVVPRLVFRGHDAVAVDLPSGDPGARLEDYVSTVVRAVPPGVARAAGGAGLVIVGQSLGGLVAPVVAQRAPVAGLEGEQIMLGGMQDTLSGACPDCGSQLEFAEGCMKCHVCGFSECG